MLLATAGVALYGKGYRFGLDGRTPQIAGTGLFVATSNPDGAQVFVNNKLTTATDDTINLTPGTYQIRITKQGYFPWRKEIEVKKEVVTKEEAFLIPTAPKLESITETGVIGPVLDPTKTRLAYNVASSSAKDDGIYVLDMTTRPIIPLQGSSTQIADDVANIFSQAVLSWSPDGKEVLATVSAALASQTYLLTTGGMNNAPRNVSAQLFTVQTDWEEKKGKEDTSRMGSLKPSLRKFVTDNFKILEWSPDEDKILYVASASATMPTMIKPPLIGTNSTAEDRVLRKDEIYVYDIKEDRNYRPLVKTTVTAQDIDQTKDPESLTWFPNSRHLVYVHDKKIDILEYDGRNQTTVYAGPFIDNFVFPWPDGSKIVILTNFNNPNVPPNLYTISLK